MVEVKTEGSPKTVRAFIGQLRDMLTKLVDAQNKHRKIHAKMMVQCVNEEKFRTAEIKTAKDALKRSLAARTRCAASLKNAVKALPQLQQSLKTYVGEYMRARRARAVEKSKYLRRKTSFAEAMNFLGDFTDYITKKMKSTYKAFALAEMSQNLLKHSAKLNIMEEAVPVLVAIASEKKNNDYTYVANQGLGQRLQTALQALMTRLKTDNAENNRVEKVAAAVYAVYAKRVKAVINTLRQNIKRLKAQIVRMTRCVDKETQVMAKAAKKEARNTVLRKNAQRMCKSFNKEFIEATYNRLDEIKTMQEILKIVKNRFKDLPADLVAYLEVTKNGWVKYVNSTKFNKFKEYERKRYAVNKRGKLLSGKNAHKRIAFFF